MPTALAKAGRSTTPSRGAERMTAIIQELMAQQVRATAEQDYVRLLREARFEHVASVLSIMSGGIGVWIAR